MATATTDAAIADLSRKLASSKQTVLKLETDLDRARALAEKERNRPRTPKERIVVVEAPGRGYERDSARDLRSAFWRSAAPTVALRYAKSSKRVPSTSSGSGSSGSSSGIASSTSGC